MNAVRSDHPASGGAPGRLESGLTPSEAARLLAETGPNELPAPARDGLARRALRQLREPLAILLIVAAVISGVAVHEMQNAIAITAIVVLNAVIGLLEEGRAARALEALRSLETPQTRVIRDGVPVTIASRELVPGDVVVLAAGDRVPADLVLQRASALEVDESILTGESLPVGKRPEAGHDESGLSSGTLVTRGSGEGLVTATGPRTRLGSIAAGLGGPDQRTPMQQALARLTAQLGAIAVVIAAAVFVLTLVRLGTGGGGLQESFLSAVALAVAAVPEGLATVVAVALALGVRRMAACGAIVRKLPAVETLGSTTVILTDKTGTITENRLSLVAVGLPWQGWCRPDELDEVTAHRVAEVAVLCNDATGHPPEGDPVDVALVEGFGVGITDALRAASPRRLAVPFDADRRRMTTVHETGDGPVVFVKGAPETVVGVCARGLRADGSVRPLAPRDRDALTAMFEEQAARGVRVLALATARPAQGPATPEDLAALDGQLELVAFAGLRDRARAEAPAAVADARSAGIRLVMVTGDHPGTASAIAEEVGLTDGTRRVLTGRDLRDHGIPDDPLEAAVYARTDPGDKLALVEALQGSGHVVAVTGDGVNDAPALKRADIGVAMGRSGSDVAREAADMVVTDDNLATIVTAVREGRGIYDNIRKVIDYLVAGNLSEITVVVVTLLAFPGLGIPLLPLQLLWLNLLTDGPPAIALGVDPPDGSLMRRPPRGRAEGLLEAPHAALLYLRALLIAGAAIGGLVLARFGWHESWAVARTQMFTVLITAHLLYAYAVRRPRSGRNPWLFLSVAGGIALQVLVVTWPAAHSLFGLVPLDAREWVATAVIGSLPVLIMMAAARLRYRRQSRRAVDEPDG